jgi:NADH:ubiquinone oxidoreductase subunit 3 (subunit A)
MAVQFLPVLMVFVIACLVVAGMMGFAVLVGQRARTHSPMKRQPYEGGVPPFGTAQRQIPVKFYLVALAFVVLDVEVAFLYPWAVTYRSFLAGHSMTVFWDMLAFTALLALAYAFLWKKGVFDWTRRKPHVDTPVQRGDS